MSVQRGATYLQLERYRRDMLRYGSWAIVVAAAASLPLLGAQPGAAGIGPLDAGATRLLLAIAAALLAIVTAAISMHRAATATSAQRPHSTAIGITAALVFAFGAGPLAVPVQMARSPELGITIGCLLAALLSTVMALVIHDRDWFGGLRLLAVILGLSGVCWGASLMLDWPAAAAAGVLLGATPLMLQALPSLCLSVPDQMLLEYDRLMRVRWTVRGTIPSGSRPLAIDDVRPLVRAAEIELTTGTVMLSALPALLVPFVMLTAPDDTFRRIALPIAMCAIALVYLTVPRRSAAGPLRIVPRLAACLLIGEYLMFDAAGRGLGVGIAAASFVIVVALFVAALISPIVNGVRSLALSRVTDIAQGTALVLALPATLIGTGWIELVRGLAS